MTNLDDYLKTLTTEVVEGPEKLEEEQIDWTIAYEEKWDKIHNAFDIISASCYYQMLFSSMLADDKEVLDAAVKLAEKLKVKVLDYVQSKNQK